MAKEVSMKNIPAEDVDEMEAALKKLGATNIKKTKNADGTFNLEGTLAT